MRFSVRVKIRVRVWVRVWVRIKIRVRVSPTEKEGSWVSARVHQINPLRQRERAPPARHSTRRVANKTRKRRQRGRTQHIKLLYRCGGSRAFQSVGMERIQVEKEPLKGGKRAVGSRKRAVAR